MQTSRDGALAAGVTSINALVLDDRNFFGDDPEDTVDAVAYAQTNLIGGLGAFAAFVEDFSGFGPAIEDKIIREIAPPRSGDPAHPAPGGTAPHAGRAGRARPRAPGPARLTRIRRAGALPPRAPAWRSPG